MKLRNIFEKKGDRMPNAKRPPEFKSKSHTPKRGGAEKGAIIPRAYLTKISPKFMNSGKENKGRTQMIPLTNFDLGRPLWSEKLRNFLEFLLIFGKNHV